MKNYVIGLNKDGTDIEVISFKASILAMLNDDEVKKEFCKIIHEELPEIMAREAIKVQINAVSAKEI